MVEYFPKILASEEKASTTVTTHNNMLRNDKCQSYNIE